MGKSAPFSRPAVRLEIYTLIPSTIVPSTQYHYGGVSALERDCTLIKVEGDVQPRIKATPRFVLQKKLYHYLAVIVVHAAVHAVTHIDPRPYHAYCGIF